MDHLRRQMGLSPFVPQHNGLSPLAREHSQRLTSSHLPKARDVPLTRTVTPRQLRWGAKHVPLLGGYNFYE